MATREQIKAGIDRVDEVFLDALYRIVKAFEIPSGKDAIARQNGGLKANWLSFITETYGSLAGDPIERGDQGEYEVREVIE